MTTKLPIETTGKCQVCGKRAILGDDLCEECWDASIPCSPQNVTTHNIKRIRNLTIKKRREAGEDIRKIAYSFNLRYDTVKGILSNFKRLDKIAEKSL